MFRLFLIAVLAFALVSGKIHGAPEDEAVFLPVSGEEHCALREENESLREHNERLKKNLVISQFANMVLGSIVLALVILFSLYIQLRVRSR